MLSDNIKRLICRTGFILMCVIPTMLCLKSILFPRSDREWSANFQQQFGMINEIGEVRVMSPQRIDFQALRLGADRFQSRLQADLASLQTLNDGRVLYIENAIGSVSAFWDSIARITETVAWSGKSDRPVKLHFGSMTFVENESPGAQQCVWNDLQIQVTQRGQTLIASFISDQHSDSFKESNRVQLERRLIDGGESWFVDATGFRVPAWVLKQTVPMADAMNVTCQLVDARATLKHHDDLWSGEFNGHVIDVDLDEVIGNRFGTSIDGRAKINVKSATLTKNQIVSLEGEFFSPVGKIGSNLLRRFTATLGMELVESYGRGAGDERYSNLRFGFQLTNDQVSFLNMLTGAIINDANGNSMLIARHGQNVPVSGIVRLLSPEPTTSNSGFINTNALSLARHLVMPGGPIERTARQTDVGERR